MITRALEKEITQIIVSIIDTLMQKERELEKQLDLCQKENNREWSLENAAAIAELRIRRSEIRGMKKEILKLIKGSTNKLVVAMIKPIES